MLERLRVRNYRSLRDASIEFGQLTVVTGPNGSGKSNLYRSLELLQAAAVGRFSQTLLSEGGMPSSLWAGDRGKGPVRMNLTAQWADLTHALEAGLVAVEPGNPFVLDPEIKEEYVFLGRARTKAGTIADRSALTATVVTADGEKRRLSSLNPAESILDQVGEPGLYPELAMLGRRMRGWRFYHQFDTGRASPVRRPQPGVRTNALASDGSDLGAAVATLFERGDHRALLEAVDAAFPGYSVVVDGPPGTFGVGLVSPGLRRPLGGPELSDGQLRFLCLATALLSSRPPELLVLNEPETSLHPSAVAALAPLILEAAKFSQIWVTTHDETLRGLLAPHSTVSTLTLVGGATSVRLDE